MEQLIDFLSVVVLGLISGKRKPEKKSINAVVGDVLKKLRMERMFKKRIVTTDVGILCHCVMNAI